MCPLTRPNWCGGPKLQHKVNLLKSVVFLGGQNHNFRKLRESKV